MQRASRRATDPFQSRIEVFLKPDFYYDRQRGRYKDQGMPVAQIVGMTELAQSVIAIVLQEPDGARARPGNYFTNDDDYVRVFNDQFDLRVFRVSIELVRRVDQFLSSKELDLRPKDKRNLMFYAAMHLASAVTGSASPNWHQIKDINVAKITIDQISISYQSVKRSYAALGGDDNAAKGVALVQRVKSSLKRKMAKPRKKF
jgi:hypothetical protein